MDKKEIFINGGTDYLRMTRELLEHCDLKSLIPDPECRIGIKPNLVAPSRASDGATTHPEVVAGIIEYLKEHGFTNILILEGSWVGDRTEEAFEVCGYRELSEHYQVPFLDMQKEKAVSVTVEDLELKVCEAALKLDFLINVPVLKGHCQTKLTCALKNMKGLLPNSEKRHFHAMGLHKPIGYLSRAIRQDFIVVDHICGDLDFEDGGNPVVTNQVIAGRDPVLIDAVAAQMLHYDVRDIPYIEFAGKAGVGCADPAAAEICYIGRTRPRDLPASRKVVEVQDIVEEVESCSACYGYLIPVLNKFREEGILDKLPDRICIGQGYRGKGGSVGIGNCTRLFDNSLEGCPPLPDAIETFLRNYIKGSRGESKQ